MIKDNIMTSSTVRAASQDDLKKLVLVSRHTFFETFVGDFSRPYTKNDLIRFYSTHHALDNYQYYLNNKDYGLYVLVVDKEIVGYSLAGPCSLPHREVTKTCGELKRVYITKDHQGYGYGKYLLEQSFNYLNDHFQKQWIGVWSGNLRAQKIYHSYGFEKVGNYIYPVGDIMDKEFILRKNIS